MIVTFIHYMGLFLIFTHHANLRIRHSHKYITTALGGGFLSQIKNEELILMYGEANAELNTVASLAQAVLAINAIRTGYGLPVYAGAVTKAALIDEVYKQRRFSLFFEGHRWFDMRRRNLLSQIQPQGTIGTQTFVVFQKMSRPDAEIQWDLRNP